jgi:hypothetical protein
MLDGYKTYLAALAAFMIALGLAIQAYVAGNTIEWNAVVQAFIALALIFLRKGVQKTQAAVICQTPSTSAPATA